MAVAAAKRGESDAAPSSPNDEEIATNVIAPSGY